MDAEPHNTLLRTFFGRMYTKRLWVLLIVIKPSDQERPPRWKNHPAEE
jgi:hypothetical protein